VAQPCTHFALISTAPVFGAKPRRGPRSRRWTLPRPRQADSALPPSACACACVHARVHRHTDATLHAAVALWFDDKAAAVARYGPIGDWDTRDVKRMCYLFHNRADFDEDIGRWNVSSVKDMRGMFSHAASFNQPLDKWDVSSVQVMRNMFYVARKFNQPLNNWDVSSVQDMHAMFHSAASFNQPLDKWAVAGGTNLNGMFAGAASFNQPATRKRLDLVLPPPPPAARARTHAALHNLSHAARRTRRRMCAREQVQHRFTARAQYAAVVELLGSSVRLCRMWPTAGGGGGGREEAAGRGGGREEEEEGGGGEEE
jgi:surface protein